MNKLPAHITDKLTLPVITAPMFLVSGPEMVMEACKAGIIGSFPLANARTIEALDRWMSTITEGLASARENEPERNIAPWAVNLVVHRTNKRYEEDLQFIEKYQPPIVVTSLGDPSKVVNIVHSYGGLVFSDVINLKHAKKAAEKGTDGLILVSSGAGGHGGTLNPFAYISAVKEFWDGIIILAGGISHGQDILAAQILGADLVYMGTRFIATKESLANPDYEHMLIQAGVEDIIYTDSFSGVHANYLKPSIVRAGLDPEKLQKKGDFNWSESKEGAKAWKDIWSAGHGVGAIKKIQSVAEVAKELLQEYESAVIPHRTK
ncbi:NAD(P)H-dependent flavin oxidoreductase [Bacillus benzoevorans]|uniref:Probable nitronate monooxygenase n=1 Tax=Bacillus benzoevorans TaxID=1456 RepID=A0A7X0LU76_9BACI|nr:nitronate monooxygenase [Bacillus benzoevorans]MBB6444268.1 nitronate monooxygenase [Bacillus benzoevorans]